MRKNSWLYKMKVNNKYGMDGEVNDMATAYAGLEIEDTEITGDRFTPSDHDLVERIRQAVIVYLHKKFRLEEMWEPTERDILKFLDRTGLDMLILQGNGFKKENGKLVLVSNTELLQEKAQQEAMLLSQSTINTDDTKEKYRKITRASRKTSSDDL